MCLTKSVGLVIELVGLVIKLAGHVLANTDLDARALLATLLHRLPRRRQLRIHLPERLLY